MEKAKKEEIKYNKFTTKYKFYYIIFNNNNFLI